MPRAGKRNDAAKAAASAGAKKAGAAGAKKSKLYKMPEAIKEGTVLTDSTKTGWKIGPSIGTGGFGEIYSACRQGENKYDYVVKCEPHDNGPLFVEMHFYIRNAKQEDIRKFQKEHGLKSIGMPYMLGNGSTEINGIKHRFIVMPRYGSDVAKHFLSNGRRLPEATCYRLALQMLDVYEFIHGCRYVHADLKAANILLGYGPKQLDQAYLVDFGLASHYTTKDFKPDPKKMHNGTIEYTSRDAHKGVPTMRADLEILGYNLIEWLGVDLPWVRDKLLNAPTKVQKAKEDFMANVTESLRTLFAGTTLPIVILEFMKYVAEMEYNEKPDYEKCRKMFQSALKMMKIPNTGDLDFKIKNGIPSKTVSPVNANAKSTLQKAKVKKGAALDPEDSEDEAAITRKKPSSKVGMPKKEPIVVLDDSEDEMINASDDDDGDVIFETRNPAKKDLRNNSLKTQVAKSTRRDSPKTTQRTTPKYSPTKTSNSLKRKSLNSSSPNSSPSPSKKTKLNGSFVSPKNNRRTPLSRQSPSGNSPAASSSRLRRTPLNARANIRMSPAVSMSASRSGKTIINDRVTPNKKPSKTYEFNFELDVSMDANVIVNVKRKKKPLQPSQETVCSMSSSRSTPLGSKTGDDSSSTPVTKVNVRKMVSGSDVDSPRTPAVTVKKSRRVVRTPM